MSPVSPTGKHHDPMHQERQTASEARAREARYRHCAEETLSGMWRDHFTKLADEQARIAGVAEAQLRRYQQQQERKQA